MVKTTLCVVVCWFFGKLFYRRGKHSYKKSCCLLSTHSAYVFVIDLILLFMFIMFFVYSKCGFIDEENTCCLFGFIGVKYQVICEDVGLLTQHTKLFLKM